MYFLRLRGYFGRWLPPWGLIRRDLLRRTFLGTQGAATYLSAADTFQILFLNAKMMAGCPLANPFSYRRAHAPEMCVRSSGEGSSCQTQPAATRGVLSPIFRLLAAHRAGAGTCCPRSAQFQARGLSDYEDGRLLLTEEGSGALVRK